MSDAFVLDPRLVRDTHRVADLPLSRVLLMNDSRYPWLILVPRRSGLRELADLQRAEQHILLEEIDHASSVLRRLAPFDKLNIGAIGNVVEQLHVHVIARRRDDDAWPAPVWGRGTALPYADDATLRRLQAEFSP